MIADVILNILNRQPLIEIQQRSTTDRIIYICQDGRITKVIKEANQ